MKSTGEVPLIAPGDFLKVTGWLIAKVAERLPFRLLVQLSYCKGLIAFALNPKLRERHRKRLARFHKGQSVEWLNRTARNLVAFSETSAAIKHLEKQGRLKVARWCRIEGQYRLEGALAGGRGAILLTGHFGWPQNYIMPALASFGYDVTQLGLQGRKEERLSRFARFFRDNVLRIEAQNTRRPLISSSLNLRPLFQLLSENRIVLTAGDAKASSSLTTVDFLGQQAEFNSGIFSVARYKEVPVLPLFAVPGRLGHPQCTLAIGDPIPVPTSEDEREDLRVATQYFARQLEQYVQAHPYYYMGYRALKRPPQADVEARYRRRPKPMAAATTISQQAAEATAADPE